MTTIEYLDQIRRTYQIIEQKLGMLEQLRAMATRTTSVIGGNPSGGGQGEDRIGDIVARMADLQEETNRDTDRLADLRQEAREMICEAGSPEEQLVLEMRYVWLMDWEKIAEAMHYTQRNVYYLHRSGMKALEEKRKERNTVLSGGRRSSADFR